MNKNTKILLIVGGSVLLLGTLGFVAFKMSKKQTSTSSDMPQINKEFVKLPIENKEVETFLNDKLTVAELKELRKWIMNWTSKWHKDNEQEQVASATWEMRRKNPTLLPSFPTEQEWEYLNQDIIMMYN
jgi:hypothetical protein